MSLLKEFQIRNLSFQIGSDHHWPLNQAEELLQNLLQEKRTDLLFLLGDQFITKTNDASPQINYVVGELAKSFALIFYTPGNHCLRGRNNPWGSFNLPENVIYPRNALDTRVTEINGLRVLIGNLFYDQKFLDPSLLGFSSKEVAEFYRTQIDDGANFMAGDTSLFPKMTDALAEALDEHIDVIATHALQHPALVTFRVPALTKEMQILSKEMGVSFICDPSDDQSWADNDDQRWSYDKGLSAKELRNWWNFKSFIMGSNVLTHPAAKFKNGLVALYGHNHRGACDHKIINEKNVEFFSHQCPKYHKNHE